MKKTRSNRHGLSRVAVYPVMIELSHADIDLCHAGSINVSLATTGGHLSYLERSTSVTRP